ncbi:MAG: S-layer homology domain-containing protein [Eubacteriales bacterium]
MKKKKKKIISKVLRGTVAVYAALLVMFPNFSQAFASGGFDTIIVNNIAKEPEKVGVDREILQAKTEEELRDEYESILLAYEDSISSDMYRSLFADASSGSVLYNELSSSYDIGKNIKSHRTVNALVNYSKQQYKDLNGSEWYARDVALGSALGITYGYPDGTFKPSNKVTRLEFLSMLSRAAKGKGAMTYQKYEWNTNNGKKPYHVDSEIAKDTWYETEYEVFGSELFPEGTYTKEELNEPITRYEAAYWIFKAWKYVDGDNEAADQVLEYALKPEVKGIKFFTDNYSINETELTLSELKNKAGQHSNSAEEQDFGEYYIKPEDVKSGKEGTPEWYALQPIFLERWGIIAGYEDGSFKGYNEITRAEAVAFINRYCTPILRTENIEKSTEGYFYSKTELEFFLSNLKYPDHPDGYITDEYGNYVVYDRGDVSGLTDEEAAEMEIYPEISITDKLNGKNANRADCNILLDFEFKTELQLQATWDFLAANYGTSIADEIMSYVEKHDHPDDFVDIRNKSIGNKKVYISESFTGFEIRIF